MRKNIVAGNWKMNNTLSETQNLLQQLTQEKQISEAKILVAPSFTNLIEAKKILKNTAIEVAAQNMHQDESGAFTGEVSASMLQSIGVKTVILGHSERRAYYNETDEILAKKVTTALQNKLQIIFCFGEELTDRNAGNQQNVVANQIQNALFHLTANQFKNIILAYEPVWAIGTGETATPEQTQEMHAFIRQLIATKYNKNTAENLSILYGGSVKPSNANEIFSKPDVDGGLIGGASLKAHDFFAIINAF